MHEYVPTQFGHKDYKKLYQSAQSPWLKGTLRLAKYRDKRIQRIFYRAHIGTLAALTCPLDQVPLYMGSIDHNTIDIVKWRLTLNR
jgi:hypothetical protein